jgi:hypothetical protein
MKPSPAFLFYYQDFFSDPDVLPMSKSQQRDYLFLLGVQWNSGSIPDDIAIIARMVGSSVEDMESDWRWIGRCFEPGEGKGTLQNARMKADRDSYLELKATRIAAGRQGGKQNAKRIQAKRKQTESKPVAIAIANGEAKENLPSSSSLSSPKSSSSPSPLSVSCEEEDTFQPGAETDNSPPKPPDCPHQKIIDLYHEILPELPRVRSWRGTVRTNLATRWKEDSARQTVAWWEDFFINQVKNSSYLTGQVNSFHTNLGWLVGPKNFEKVMNGQYVDHGPSTGSARTDRNAAACKQFMEEMENE